ncbi:MAG: hypothetical protein LBQ11_02610 [Candidatus Nomurabacteria bacterium]|jgi:hypothetical protein|nr:hypothetical protein [Candidatus Nomurabacteria bacterium]
MSDTDAAVAKDKHFKNQGFVAGINAFSLVYAVQASALAIILAIQALTTGGLIGGGMALAPLQIGISAVAFGLIALLTAGKITDKEMVKKVYGIAKKVLLIEVVLMASFLVGLMLYALFAVGAGGTLQRALWLDSFLPLLAMAGVVVGLLFVAKEIKCGGNIKLIPIIAYVILGAAGVALILSIIATFIGLYGNSTPTYYW